MIIRLWLVALLLGAGMVAGCSSDSSALPTLKGKYRVIAVFADNAASAQRSENALKSTPGIKDRDIAWFVVGPDHVGSNIDDKPSRRQLEKVHTVKAFEVVLIGKDGTVAATQLGGLNLQEVFDSIDGGTMREQEINQ